MTPQIQLAFSMVMNIEVMSILHAMNHKTSLPEQETTHTPYPRHPFLVKPILCGVGNKYIGAYNHFTKCEFCMRHDPYK